MGVAPSLPAQALAFFLEGLLQCNAHAFGGVDHFVAGDLQQAAVAGVGHGLLLHGGVHDDVLELSGLNDLHLHRRLNGGFEQVLQAFFAQGLAKASDLGGIAGQARFVMLHAAEVLPNDVLAPLLDQAPVAEVLAVFEVQQADQQPAGQAWPSCVAGACCHGRWARTEEVGGHRHIRRFASSPALAPQQGGNGCFEAGPVDA